tara:strand:+ start:314 stop:1942 length:1629 start_codon:yes stop_codon:yes gene_type:complete
MAEQFKKELRLYIGRKLLELGKDLHINDKAAISDLRDHKEIRTLTHDVKTGQQLFKIENMNGLFRAARKAQKLGKDFNPLASLKALGTDTASQNRNTQLANQASDVGQPGYTPKTKARLPSGWHDHHLRFRTLFEPFFDNLNPAQVKELADFFTQQHGALGNVLANLQGLPEDFHILLKSSIHTWAKQNNIQVSKGKVGESNFTIKDGEITKVRGGGINPQKVAFENARFPNLSKFSLNERLPMVSDYLHYVVPAIEDYTAKLVRKSEKRLYGSKRARSIREIKRGWHKLAADAAARSTILQDNPWMIPKDLDSPIPTLDFLRRAASYVGNVEPGNIKSQKQALSILQDFGSGSKMFNLSLPGLAAGGLNLLGGGAIDAATEPEVIGQAARIKRAIEEGDEETKADAIDKLKAEAGWAAVRGFATGAVLGKTGLASKLGPYALAAAPLVAAQGYDKWLKEYTDKGLGEHYSKFQDKRAPLHDKIEAGDRLKAEPLQGEWGQGTKLNPIQQVGQEIENRKALVKERFNPSRGEWGLSEALYGR